MNHEKKQRTKCFPSVEEAIDYRNKMLLDVASKKGTEHDLASRKKQDPYTGALLPHGVRYLSHFPNTPFQSSWKNTNDGVEFAYFKSLQEAIDHRIQMVKQIQMQKRSSSDSKLKRIDQATGNELPAGILYLKHCPSAPYQANWQGIDRQQHTKCFNTVEDALKYRNDMIKSIVEERSLYDEPDLKHTESHAIETAIIAKCVASCKALALDTRLWQAGTRSDFGHRPYSKNVDLWVPVQAKTTLTKNYPYRFFIRGEYEMDLACFPGHGNGAFVFDEKFMNDNASSLYGGNGMYISEGSIFDTGMLLWSQYVEKMTNRWNSEFELHKTDVSLGRVGDNRLSKLRSEIELRMQCTENSQREIVTQMLMQSVIVGPKYEWSQEPNGIVDRLIDGKTTQDKVAHSVSSGCFSVNTTKKISGKPVPYSEDDIDQLVACTIHNRLRLLLVWVVPIHELKYLGIVQTKTSKGSTSLKLPIAMSGGTNKELEERIFGSKVYSGNRYTAKFMKVYPLPVDYCVPHCMQGRDYKVCKC